MRKGTFSVRKAKSNSKAHNDRTEQPKYLIGCKVGQNNYYELIQSDDDFILEAQQLYKQKIKQNMQKKQIDNLIQETVITITEEQNEDDIKALFEELQKEYGGHTLLEVAIHRDEGHFERDGIAYYLTKNMIKIDDKYYICSDDDIAKPKLKDFDLEVDINEFERVYNYHAHAKFSMFDKKTCKSARMQKKDMSSRIKFVSNFLGLDYNPNSETSRTKKAVHQVKDEHLAKARAKEKELAKLKNLQELNKLMREQLKEFGATRADYAELEKLNAELKQKIKAKDLTIDDLRAEIESLKDSLLNSKKENSHLSAVVELKEVEIQELKNKIADKDHKIEQLKEIVNDREQLINDFKEVKRQDTELIDGLRNANKSLQEQNKLLESKSTNLDNKSVSSANMSDYESIKKENAELKRENKSLRNYLENIIELLPYSIKKTIEYFKDIPNAVSKAFDELKKESVFTKTEEKRQELDSKLNGAEQREKNRQERLKALEDNNLDFDEFMKQAREKQEDYSQDIRDFLKENDVNTKSNLYKNR